MVLVVQEDYTTEENDPEGSVSVYALDPDSGKFTEPCTADFTRFNDEDLTKDLMESGVRVTGVNTTTFSQVPMRTKPSDASYSPTPCRHPPSRETLHKITKHFTDVQDKYCKSHDSNYSHIGQIRSFNNMIRISIDHL